MMTRIGKKIGMALLSGSMALLIPFTAAAQYRDDHRFGGNDRNDHRVVQQHQMIQQRPVVQQHQVFQQRVVEPYRAPVRVVERRDFRGSAPLVRDRAYQEGFRAGVNSRVGNGYYDSFGNWCAR
jgi:hypothetical protein